MSGHLSRAFIEGPRQKELEDFTQAGPDCYIASTSRPVGGTSPFLQGVTNARSSTSWIPLVLARETGPQQVDDRLLYTIGFVGTRRGALPPDNYVITIQC